MIAFALSEGFIGGTSIKIEAEKYNGIKRAKEILSAIRDTEDSFSLLANSFIEFEEHLLRAGLEYFFQRDLQRSSENYFDDVRQGVNLRLVAVLTASRLYEEQLYRRASFLSDVSKKSIEIKKSFSEQYDEKLEYRVMYALRNHSLHNQLPVNYLSFGTNSQSSSGKVKDGSPSRFRVSIIPKLTVADFCASDKIKPAIRDEVRALGFKHLDLRFFSRGFLACIAICHEQFRTMTDDIVNLSLDELKDASDQLKDAKGESPTHPYIRMLDDGKTVEEHYIDYSIRSKVREQRTYWTGLTSTQHGFVSSEIVKSRDTYPLTDSGLWIPD